MTYAEPEKPGWYRGGSPAMWRWWDGSAWKPLEPGDQKAAEKALNARIGGWVAGVIAVLVVAGIAASAIAGAVS